MVNSTIAPEVLAREFSVVRNEFEMGENNPTGVLEERMMSSAYLWHNYGKSTIGSRADIERVPAERLRAFYRKYYRPDNAMLVVAGRFEPEATLALVQRHYGAIPRPAAPLEPTYTVEPVQDGERTVTLRRTGDVQVVGLAYHTVAGSDPRAVAVDAIVDLLTDEPSGRLYQALVKTGMATRVWGYAYDWAEPGALLLFAEVRQDKAVEPVRAKMIQVVEGLAAAKLGDDEVARFRNQYLKNFELALTDSQEIAVELSEYAAMGDWRLLFLGRDRVEKVQKAEVQQAAAAWLKPTNRTVGLFLPTRTPDRAPLPAQPDVPAMVQGYQGKDAMTAGEDFEATVANVERRTTRVQLAGGLKLAFLPKQTRGNAVHATLTLHFATEQDVEVKGRKDAGGMVADLLLRGTTKHSYQQLKDELDRLKTHFGCGGGATSATCSLTTTRENLAPALALAAEVLRQPTFPADQFEIVRKEALAGLEQQLQDPQAQAFVTVMRKVDPQPADDVRYHPTTQEQIDRTKAIKLADVKKWHQDFWGASNAELTLVGDFDPKAVQGQVETLLGGWKSPRPFRRIEDRYRETAPADEVVNTPDKEMTLVAVAHQLEVRDDDPDYPALEMLNYLLGASASSRLFERLRQKEGISYGAFSFVQADPLDRQGIFGAGAICAPQNADKAMAAILEEIGKMLADGVAEDELARAKKAWQLAFDNQITDDDYVAGQLNGGLYLGRTMAYQQHQNDAIQKLGPADLAKVMKKHFHPERLVKVRAGDAAKFKAAAP